MNKGRADYLKLGDWNASCASCGRKRKATELRKDWKGFYVCPEHWETRHPQDFVRAMPENQSVPWSQEPEDTFIGVCNLNATSAIADYAEADCATAESDIVPDPTLP